MLITCRSLLRYGRPCIPRLKFTASSCSSLYCLPCCKMTGMSQKAYTTGSDFVMEGMGRVDESGRSFDIEYWQRQDSAARFAAAWELVVFAHERRGGDVTELRLQRTIEHLERLA